MNMFLAAILFFTSVAWIGQPTSVSGQCFTENDDVPASDASVGTLSEGSTDFAIKLFKNVLQSPNNPTPSGNIFISPISVWSALLITFLGAKGNTKIEFSSGLGLGDLNQKKVLELYQQLQADLLHTATNNANYTTDLANKLYFDENIELRQCIVNYLTSQIQQVNFRTGTEQSRQLINQWVEDKTNNRITNLIPKGFINSDTIMVIVNAAYLKAAWARTFEKRGTSQENFFVTPSQIKQADMMHKTAGFPYGSSASMDCTALELPYSGNELSMIILLPNSDINTLISKLTKENLNSLLAALSSVTVKVTIPKFKLEQSMELTKNVKSLGIKEAFEATKADLSGFTGDKDSFISFIQHKTFIEVTEAGTEAAAATAIGISTLALVVTEVEFIADRPFVFLILSKKYNTVLFTGLIKDPTASS